MSRSYLFYKGGKTVTIKITNLFKKTVPDSKFGKSITTCDSPELFLPSTVNIITQLFFINYGVTEEYARNRPQHPESMIENPCETFSM